MTNDDDETTVTVRYGDKVVTVGQRFDKIEKMQLLQGIGILLLLGINIPSVGPILIALANLIN
jgi:hypothetical protein